VILDHEPSRYGRVLVGSALEVGLLLVYTPRVGKLRVSSRFKTPTIIT